MIQKTWLRMMSAFSCLFDEQARQVVEYLREENRVLREQLRDKYGCRQVRLTDSQRRRLATKGAAVGRRLLNDVTDLFSPDTILKWFRQLIANKYDGSPNRKGGRPKVSQEIIDTVLRLAKENPHWGFGRIRHYMVFLGHTVGKSTVKRILEDHGIGPEPERTCKTTWNEFIRSHMDVLAATDFFSVELLTPKGLVRCFVLFVIDIASRKVQIAGIKAEPDGQWMKQMARNLTQADSGFLAGKWYLIHDRDPLFTKAFDEILEVGGTKAIKTVRQSPNLNAFAERFVQSIKQECLDRMILTSQKQLEYAVEQYLIYYNHVSYCLTSLCACQIKTKLPGRWSCGPGGSRLRLQDDLLDRRAA